MSELPSQAQDDAGAGSVATASVGEDIEAPDAGADEQLTADQTASDASFDEARLELCELTGRPAGDFAGSIDLLRDVQLRVKIELGRTRMAVEDVLKLGEGSVVELDKLAGDPVDVYVNERLVARGEVLVLNDNFCVRVGEIVSGSKERSATRRAP